jgi:hypothetical protein
MRLVGTSEWIVVGVLIAYIAFTPGFPVVRQFLSTGLGKAVGLAVIVAAWKYVSHPVALLLLVNYVRCSGMREFMESGSGSTGSTGTTGSSGTTLPPNTYCPEDTTFDNGQCKNKITGQSVAATICLTGQTWDAAGKKCVGSSSASSPDTAAKQGFANIAPAGFREGFQPNMKEKGNYAPV